MTRLILLFAGWLTMTQTAWAAECPRPDDFVIQNSVLTATASAIAQKNLNILTLGGASTLGGPAGGTAFTYPARLEAHLREALPGVMVKVAVLAVPRLSDEELAMKLDDAMTANRPSLVVWGPGAGAAAQGVDLDTFIGTVVGTVAKIRSAGADVILMTLQYAPSVARLMNLSPYHMAVIQWGDEVGVPVLDRYELMRFWNETGFLDLDATDPALRVQIARTLYDCMADILARGIVDSVK